MYFMCKICMVVFFKARILLCMLSAMYSTTGCMCIEGHSCTRNVRCISLWLGFLG